MSWQMIHKNSESLACKPHLENYQMVRAQFSWEALRAELEETPTGGWNIAHNAVDRHANGPLAHKTALRWLSEAGPIQEFSYADLKALSNRFAHVLEKLGVGKGERVFGLTGRIPELYQAVLGTLKNGSVFCPLFSAFGPEPIKARMQIGSAKVLVTTPLLYKRKVAPIRAELTTLEHVIVVGDKTPEGTLNFAELMAEASPEFTLCPTEPEDMALLHFTSGTTGKPKGAIHVHEAILAHYATGKLALDLHSEDIFWCTADPGWVTGISYGMLSPLSNGVTLIVDEAEFNAERWYSILQEQKVSVWYTAPTAVRMLMKLGAELTRQYQFPALRFMGSVGEPLNPEGVVWGQEAFGMPFHDNWWQTETGAIMVANYVSADVKPGSMGRPLPGIEAGIVRHLENGQVEEIQTPDTEGELALRPGWPSMFRGYLNEEARYQKCFSDGWYLSGDLAKRDADGYFWFVGRADDVIKSAGHLIGPFEVESALMEHPAVAEVGVIGKPDPVAMEIVKAFVALKPGFEASEALQMELMGFARKRLGAAVAPREIEFRLNLPKTRSGKIMRRLLKARELGLPEGDISTLESDEK